MQPCKDQVLKLFILFLSDQVVASNLLTDNHVQYLSK